MAPARFYCQCNAPGYRRQGMHRECGRRWTASSRAGMLLGENPQARNRVIKNVSPWNSSQGVQDIALTPAPKVTAMCKPRSRIEIVAEHVEFKLQFKKGKGR